ncbi:hypothetical protein LRP30_34065 [Bradyrhizobium sp. C-145]|uniref:hypothetical protein n=1 Tax=Bradyrhizobium sp. C-145 TaxID=574727 RepID=UPI00201B8FF1|nr:hypothetical protein [Bradyrhizobium sp. C-145]UQR61783.1 hypothetical protein LRP30_34065 [Bradyrhizobium sp. C-145]
MISRDRFELALERLKSSDWGRFERLASGFLISEFPSLRTMASPSGDGGRDAELCAPVAHVILQYSIRMDWDAKIKETIKRIKETKPEAKVLIFVQINRLGRWLTQSRLMLLGRVYFWMCAIEVGLVIASITRLATKSLPRSWQRRLLIRY